MRGNPKVYDWVAITKEFVDGPFKTVTEYIKWTAERRKTMGEPRPSGESIRQASARFAWPELKAKRNNKMVQALVDGSVNQMTQDSISELAKIRTTVNKALLKVLVEAANNPGRLELRADLSDLVNDLRRGIGDKTRESEMKPAQVTVNNANIAEDSFRKRLEAKKTGGELAPAAGEKSLDDLSKTIPADQLEFLDKE